MRFWHFSFCGNKDLDILSCSLQGFFVWCFLGFVLWYQDVLFNLFGQVALISSCFLCQHLSLSLTDFVVVFFPKQNCVGANHIYLVYSSVSAQNLVRGFPPGVAAPSGWRRWCFAEWRFRTPLLFTLTLVPPYASIANGCSRVFFAKECNVKVTIELYAAVTNISTSLVFKADFILCFDSQKVVYCDTGLSNFWKIVYFGGDYSSSHFNLSSLCIVHFSEKIRFNHA